MSKTEAKKGEFEANISKMTATEIDLLDEGLIDQESLKERYDIEDLYDSDWTDLSLFSTPFEAQEDQTYEK
eukprot:8204622-Heterocapsa_arctica.AAC.1